MEQYEIMFNKINKSKAADKAFQRKKQPEILINAAY